MKRKGAKRSLALALALALMAALVVPSYGFKVGERAYDVYGGQYQMEEKNQKQTEVTQPTKLLNQDGTVAAPGWARTNLFEYNREDIAANPYQIKEWDYYQVSDGRYLVQITMANIGLGAGAFITVKDMVLNGEVVLDTGCARLLTATRCQMPRSSAQPSKVSQSLANFDCTIEYDGSTRHLTAKGTSFTPFGKPFSLDLTLRELPGLESMTIAIPYKDKPDHFFLTNKIDSMPASGTVKVGDKELAFTEDRSFGILDWGRGVWNHDTNWVWSNGSGYLPNGDILGWELTWGIGDTVNATETAVFYNGKAHKLGRVTCEFDPDDLMKPWTFHEENGRFEMTFVPSYDNHSDTNVLELVGTDGHQVHGLWNGTVTLDDGTVVEVRNMYAFCEQVNNRW
ncbi:MAG: DUF2804 domain-containing protein [Clostridia bacterium]|nr:DUF2804 domain-containing protein [Clostridia bacterium]